MLSHQNAAIIDTISAIPRQTILDCETPLIRLHALSSHLDIDLWMKRDDLAGRASPVKMNLLRAVKQALDPDRIMNPRVMV